MAAAQSARLPPNFPAPPPGKEVKVPKKFVDTSLPNNWSIRWWKNQGALMLETGNATHFTVAFVVGLSKGDLGRVKNRVLQVMEKKGRVLNVWSCFGEMWGKNSIRVGEDSCLGLMQKEVMKEVEKMGFKMENRPPHISIMKRGRE